MAQQGIGTNTPDKSSAVDIVSTKRGLLIPRLALTATNVATPVASPANSLLVYNTATAGTTPNNVTPGFYFWDTDHWVRFVDEDGEKTVIVEEGENIDVEETVNGNETTYTVSVENGGADNLVMVTIANPDFPGTPGAPEFITDWVTYDELIDATNGLNYDETTGELKLGGTLTENTTISVDEFDMIFDGGFSEGGTIKLTNLEAMDPDAAIPAGANVAVMLADGTLQTYSLEDLLEDLTVTADNGLTMDTNNNIQLGGDLITPTTIVTGTDGSGGTDTANTIAITNLEAADEANNIVVSETNGGVLRTVKRTVSSAITADLTINDTNISDYSPYVQEINISATIPATGDIDVTLPAAGGANSGQVVNIKIANTTDAHTGYLNIIANGGTLTYGAMPFQGWILKSNGTSWVIVGRN
ncbi:hypothetical protein DNG35_06865 [Mesonia sp. K7]|nr:hypothetical protein DNG35_06865 [Mesonia sp. K7]